MNDQAKCQGPPLVGHPISYHGIAWERGVPILGVPGEIALRWVQQVDWPFFRRPIVGSAWRVRLSQWLWTYKGKAVNEWPSDPSNGSYLCCFGANYEHNNVYLNYLLPLGGWINHNVWEHHSTWTVISNGEMANTQTTIWHNYLPSRTIAQTLYEIQVSRKMVYASFIRCVWWFHCFYVCFLSSLQAHWMSDWLIDQRNYWWIDRFP